MMTGHPDIDAIVGRAQRYREMIYRQLGSPPSTFLMTDEEFRVFLRFEGQRLPSVEDVAGTEVILFGMRVVCPQRVAWSGESLYMEHFKRSPHVLSTCRTECPHDGQPEVVCPCGEVIWEMPDRMTVDAALWAAQYEGSWDVARPDGNELLNTPMRPIEMSAREMAFRTISEIVYERLPAALGVHQSLLGDNRALRETDHQIQRASNGELAETPDAALPDETLRCCGQEWPTHVAWMGHFREVHG